MGERSVGSEWVTIKSSKRKQEGIETSVETDLTRREVGELTLMTWFTLELS